MTVLSGLFLLFLYLAIGYCLYHRRYPDSFLPYRPSPERERLARTGRRRVLPLPRREEP